MYNYLSSKFVGTNKSKNKHGISGFIQNNYNGLPAGMLSKIPALTTTDVNGETVGTLEGNLRVKNGLVGLSNPGKVGQTNAAGNAHKELMDGIYVNDAWTGNLDGNGQPIYAYSDNGTTTPYDEGSALDFPTYANDNGDDHMAYYLEDFVPQNQSGPYKIYNGTISIKPDENYYWSASDGLEVKGKDLGTDGMPTVVAIQQMMADNEYFVWFDKNTNHR